MNQLLPIIEALRAAGGGSIEICVGEYPKEDEGGEEGEEGESEGGAEEREEESEPEGGPERRSGYNRTRTEPVEAQGNVGAGNGVREALMKAMG